MPVTFAISEIRPEGKVELGQLSGEETYVGREPNPSHTHIVVPSDAVSREHGVFLRIREHWLYKDLGSTNGSWINGLPVRQGQMRLIRSGDVIQVADHAVQVSALGVKDGSVPQMEFSSLLVFLKSEFIEEYPIPSQGRVLSIGGQKSDLKFDVETSDRPSVLIERSGNSLVATKLSSATAVYHNEREIQGSVSLRDRDELNIANYTIVANASFANTAMPLNVSHAGKDYSEASEPRTSPQGPMGVSATQTFNAADIQARLVSHKANSSDDLRFGKGIMSDGLRAQASRDLDGENEGSQRIVKFFIRVLLMSAAFILLWWVFFQ